MYHTAKRLPDEEHKMSHSQVKKPTGEERAAPGQEPRRTKRAGLTKEPMINKQMMLSRSKWFRGAPAREHGAGSRAGSPDAFAVSPSLRGGPTWRFESSIPG